MPAVTPEERQAEFIRDLNRLLLKHGATLEVVDRTARGGWDSHGVAEIHMSAQNDAMDDYASFDLPAYMDGKD